MTEHKTNIISAIIAAVATIIAACIGLYGVILQRENTNLTQNNSEMQGTISELENRISDLEAKNRSLSNDTNKPEDENTPTSYTNVDTYNLDIDVISVIRSAQNQYVEFDAESLYRAEEIISEALRLLPDNSQLLSEYNFYKEHEPIKLSDWLLGSKYFSTLTSAVDNFGAVHSNVIYVQRFTLSDYDWNEGKHMWYSLENLDLDFQYRKITGTLFQSERYKAASTETKFSVNARKDENIYGDFIVLWSGKVTGDTEPKKIIADVSGRKYVSLYFQADSVVGKSGEPYYYAYLSDLYLWK